jgi:ABC-2 type transport system permease protein
MRDHLRIVWTIAWKDLLEGLRSRQVLIGLVTVGLMVIFYRFMPAIVGEDDQNTVWVYDPAQSPLVQQFEDSDSLNVTRARTRAQMLELVRESITPELGLVIPHDIDRQIASGDPVTLDAYLMHWTSDSQRANLVALAEAALGHGVRLNPHILYLEKRLTGPMFTAAFALLFAVLLVGLSTIPHLMLEEKETRTLEALLVSPASAWHVVGGKALAGVGYTVLAVGLVFALYTSVIVHWWVAVLAALLGIVFATLLGLLLGTLVQVKQQLTLTVWLIFPPLLIPVFLAIMRDVLPTMLLAGLDWIPSVALANVFHVSAMRTVATGDIAREVVWLLVCDAALIGLVIWAVRRQGQERHGRAQAVERVEAPMPVTTAPLQLEPASGRPAASGIIGAIFAKDVFEALRNRTILGILIGVGVLMVSGQAMPLLVRLDDTPHAVVYDAGQTGIVETWRRDDDMIVHEVDSMQAMQDQLRESGAPLLGLVVTADGVEAAIANVTGQEKADELIGFFAGKLRVFTKKPVELRPDVVYPRVDTGGYPLMMALVLVLVVLSTCVAVVPHLFIEEKTARTLDVLLVSPANLRQLVLAKALAGMVFGIVAVSVILAFNAAWITQWGLAILTGLSATALSVMLGLLLGIWLDNTQSLGIWASVVIVALAVPLFVFQFGGDRLSPTLEALFRWLPTMRVADLLRMSLGESVPIRALTEALVIIWGAVVAIGALVVWRLGRLAQVG